MPDVNGGIPVYFSTVGENEPQRLGSDNLVLVDNPSNINIHTTIISEDEMNNSLKYMCNEGYKNYTNSSLVDSGCTWSVTTNNTCNNGQLLLATITINGFTIYAYKGNNNEIIYLTDKNNIGKIITRPNKNKIDEFFDSLDNFQKILLNRDTNYTTMFEVVTENSFGYVTELKSFTFPTTFGGYNLAVGNAAYNTYVSSLQKYAEFYDEYFCDNIWRSMTHESIKNFDWTYTREYGIGEEEEYIFGGTRIQKTLRLIGREFDEIKTYIDALKNYQKVDYGKNNALPDYFLTDTLSEEGWDVDNIYPYNDNLKQIQKLNNNTINPYSNAYVISGYSNGYFILCNDNCTTPSHKNANNYPNKNEIYDECINGLRPKIKQYTSEKEYSISDINNHFMRMLKLNSKAIFRKKGTIQAIESLLSIFGLKSKRWVTEFNETARQYDRKYVADYEIKEYVTHSNKFIGKGNNIDVWDSEKNMHEIDWYNFTKTVAYDTDDYRNGIYHAYQGLPVRGYINNSGKYHSLDSLPSDVSFNNNDVYLYPYFSKNKIIDGNPYYQMYGGWLNRKPKIFNVNNEVVNNDIPLFKETYRDIRTVNNLKDLINIPKTSLKSGDVCYVNDLTGEYALIEGVIYDIYYDDNGAYIKTQIINNSAKVGNKLFASELTVSDKNSNLVKYVFNEYEENTEIRIYIKNNGSLIVYGRYYGINNVSFYINGEIKNTFDKNVSTVSETSTLTNWFQLNDIEYKYEISTNGWNRLSETDNKTKKIDTIIDKFKGNNPHTGHMNYDGGKEYLNYFSQLFKHAIETNQFDERCYGDGFYSELENIKNIGFDGLDDNTKEYCYPIYEDTKIHFLGDHINKNGNKTSNTLKNSYSGTSINNKLDNTNISDQIINVKRVDINFFNNDNNAIIKYFDSVIMNYLEQVLPSTLIINVNYCETNN